MLGGCPHLKTFLVYILAAGGSTVHGILGALKGCKTDGTVSLYRLAVPILAFPISVGVYLDGRGVLEDVMEFG
jgi:hypothetical protein